MDGAADANPPAARLGAAVNRKLIAHPRVPGGWLGWLTIQFAPCESPERLLAYYRGELVSAQQDAVQEHLSRCRECADLLLAIPALLGDDAEGAEG